MREEGCGYSYGESGHVLVLTQIREEGECVTVKVIKKRFYCEEEE